MLTSGLRVVLIYVYDVLNIISIHKECELQNPEVMVTSRVPNQAAEVLNPKWDTGLKTMQKANNKI